MLGRLLRGIVMVLVLLAFAILFGVYYVYEVVDSGELILDNAPGVVTIVREADTSIIHIKGDDWKSIAYGQGFTCA